MIRGATTAIAAVLALAGSLVTEVAGAQQTCHRDCLRGSPRDAFGCCLETAAPPNARPRARRRPAPDAITIAPRFVDLRPRAFMVFNRVQRRPSFEQVVAPAHHAWRAWVTMAEQLRNAARAWSDAREGYEARLRPLAAADPRRRTTEAERDAAQVRWETRAAELEERVTATRREARTQIERRRRSGFDDLALAELVLDEQNERYHEAYLAAESAGRAPPSPLDFYAPALLLAERAAGRLTGRWKAYAFYFAGYLAFEGMDYPRACAHLERAIELDGGRSDFAGDAAFRLGQYWSDFGTTPEELGRARDAYQRAIEIQRSAGSGDRVTALRYLLAWVHRRLDEPGPALGHLVAVAASTSEIAPEAAEEAAGLLYNAGDYVGRTLPADTPGPLVAQLLLLVGDRLVEEEALPLAAPVLEEAARRGGEDPQAVTARRMARVVRSALQFAGREDTERWLRRAVERCRPRLSAPAFDPPPVDAANGFEIDFEATRTGDAAVSTRAELRSGAPELADRTLRCLRDPMVPPYGHTGSFRMRARLIFPLPRDPVSRGI